VTPEGQEPLINGVARDISARRQRIRQAELTATIGTALTSQRNLTDQLQACAQALVDHLGASLVRIWLTGDQPSSTLSLRASTGPNLPDDDTRVIVIGEGRV